MVIDFFQEEKKSLNCRPAGLVGCIFFFHRLVSLFTKSSNNYGRGGSASLGGRHFFPKSWLALSEKFFQ